VAAFVAAARVEAAGRVAAERAAVEALRHAGGPAEVHPVALLGVVEHAVATLEARGGVELARGVTRERAAVEALARAGGSAELRVVALLARDGVDGEVTTLDEGAVGVAAQRFASIVALL